MHTPCLVAAEALRQSLARIAKRRLLTSHRTARSSQGAMAWYLGSAGDRWVVCREVAETSMES